MSYFILSASQSGNTTDENHKSSDFVRGVLTRTQTPFKESKGCYKYLDGRVCEEDSFIVPAKYESLVLKLAEMTEQESVLFVQKGFGFLIYSDKTEKIPGRMQEVVDVSNLEAYTEVDGKYYSII